jgi:hypothetical protein
MVELTRGMIFSLWDRSETAGAWMNFLKKIVLLAALIFALPVTARAEET